MTEADQITAAPMPAFDMLLGELQRSCGLSEWQARQMRDVFRGYAGQEVHVPAARTTRREESAELVRRMVVMGMARADIVRRLVCRGHGRRCAYELVERVLGPAGGGA
jgi:hypothetical protein